MSSRAARRHASLFVLLLAGCATARPPQPSVYDGPLPPLDINYRLRPVSEGSLFDESAASDLVGDFRAHRIGDVLTVKISESSLGRTSADDQLEKTGDIKLEAPVIFGYEGKVAGKLGPLFDPKLALDASSAKTFEGSGQTSRNNSLTGTIAVRVLAVGTGGQLLVAGQKEITVNHEKQRITLAGIVRREDVAADNSIPSNVIADLTIHYGGRGDINDTIKQGWFHKLISKIWPF
jgi:flagellar L-ring protein precursor FlgH